MSNPVPMSRTSSRAYAHALPLGATRVAAALHSRPTEDPEAMARRAPLNGDMREILRCP